MVCCNLVGIAAVPSRVYKQRLGASAFTRAV